MRRLPGIIALGRPARAPPADPVQPGRPSRVALAVFAAWAVLSLVLMLWISNRFRPPFDWVRSVALPYVYVGLPLAVAYLLAGGKKRPGNRWMALGVAVLGAVVVGSAFLKAVAWTHDVVRTETTPDGRYVAELVEENGGATTSFGYEVLIRRKGSRQEPDWVVYGYGTSRSKSAYGMNLSWVSDNELLVSYHKTRELNTRDEPLTLDGRTFKVTVRGGVLDETAPPGGMLWNLQNRP